MRDEYYLLLDEDNLSSTKNGNAFNRLWIPSTPVVFEASATGTVSSSTTVKIQESDDKSSWSDLHAFTITSAGKLYARLLVSKKYVRGAVTSAGSIGHLEVGIVPAGEFTSPA